MRRGDAHYRASPRGAPSPHLYGSPAQLVRRLRALARRPERVRAWRAAFERAAAALAAAAAEGERGGGGGTPHAGGGGASGGAGGGGGGDAAAGGGEVAPPQKRPRPPAASDAAAAGAPAAAAETIAGGAPASRAGDMDEEGDDLAATAPAVAAALDRVYSLADLYREMLLPGSGPAAAE